MTSLSPVIERSRTSPASFFPEKAARAIERVAPSSGNVRSTREPSEFIAVGYARAHGKEDRRVLAGRRATKAERARAAQRGRSDRAARTRAPEARARPVSYRGLPQQTP